MVLYVFAVITPAKIYRTTNGGSNWAEILSTGSEASFINDIIFLKSNPDFGVVFADPPDRKSGKFACWTNTKQPRTAPFAGHLFRQP